MTHVLPFTLIFFAVIAGLSSCTKSQLNKDTSIAEDHAMAQWLWSDVGNQVEGSYVSSDLDGQGLDKWSCATVSVDSSSSAYPLTVTLDFGVEGCKGRDGQTRRGKLIYTISGPYTAAGTIITVASNDYYVNDYRIEGSRKLTNEGQDSQSRLHFQVSVTDAVITTPDQKTITWASEHTKTWVEGSDTGFFTEKEDGTLMGIDGLLDDVFEVTGGGSGINRDGRSFTTNITEPLRVPLSCRWITSGEVMLRPESLEPRVLDYGEGGCDNEATVTIDANKYTIELRG